MEEYRYFTQTSDPQIHAALIGISKLDWVKATHRENYSEVREIMQKNSFDVLPLLNKDGTYTQFYITSTWGNYSDGIRYDFINEKNCIYYLTNLRDVFRQFNNNEQNFFFLSNHSEVIGLITIANLNCKHVYLYLYNLINQLEKKLAKYLVSNLSRQNILELLKTYVEDENVQSPTEETLERFFKDTKDGVDADIIEYLYLSEIFMIYRDKKLFKQLGYTSEHKFCFHNSKIMQLRNIVSHPNKSLISKRESINDVWCALLKIEDLISRIN